MVFLVNIIRVTSFGGGGGGVRKSLRQKKIQYNGIYGILEMPLVKAGTLGGRVGCLFLTHF